MTPDLTILVLIGLLGAGIGIGKLLVTGVPLTKRLLLGHALVNTGLALGALALLAAIPGLSFTAQVGLGAAIASGGTAFLDKLLSRVFLQQSSPSTPPQ